MKKWLASVVVMGCFSLLFSLNVAASSPTVEIDGQVQRYDQDPVIESGRTLVPMRGIFESLGAQVNWNQSTKKITAEHQGTLIELTVGSQVAFVDSNRTYLDVPARITNQNRTLVPLRFVGEALGASVNWHAGSRTVVIQSGAGGSVPQAPVPETSDSIDLIRGMTSGMSKREVLQNEPSVLMAEEFDRLYFTDARQYGLWSSMMYSFHQNELTDIFVMVDYLDSYSLDDLEVLFMGLLGEIESDFGRADFIDFDWLDDSWDYILYAHWNATANRPEISLSVKVDEITYEATASYLFSSRGY